MSSPLETPPSMPPALLCGRVKRVGLPVDSRGVVDRIVNLGAERLGSRNAAADLDGLHRLQAHHRPGKQAVEPLVPVGVGAEAGGNAVGHHFKDAAHGVAGAGGLFDFFFHARFGGGIDAD